MKRIKKYTSRQESYFARISFGEFPSKTQILANFSIHDGGRIKS